MSSNEKTKGPASYFPSIEKTYGQPIAFWQDIVRTQDGKTHTQIVQFLKETHSLGHGHANALVAATLAEAKKDKDGASDAPRF